MTKTEFMLVRSRQRLSTLTISPTFAINDFPVINWVSTAKSLGVTVDDNLDWGSYIRNIIKKVCSGIEAIKRVRHPIPQATLHLIFRALLLPQFNYCTNDFFFKWKSRLPILLSGSLTTQDKMTYLVKFLVCLLSLLSLLCLLIRKTISYFLSSWNIRFSGQLMLDNTS